PSHIAGVFFQKQTGTSFRFVPYRGSAPMMQDLLGGRVDLIFDQAADALPHVRGHKIRAYAVTAASRLKSEASIPTVDEEGLRGFYVSVWHGLWVPRGTPQAIVTTLNTAAVQALADPNVRARFSGLGQEIPSSDQQTPEGLGILQKAEMKKWWPIVRAANIKVE
ncbi:MAG TPA: tripartite tricarboxylate transporter substrate-binding protein, partial [Pseudolabrys sp.]